MIGLNKLEHDRLVELRLITKRLKNMTQQKKEQIGHEMRGYYKKLVLEIILFVFEQHYGVSIDYNSLIDAVSFNYDYQTMEPSFSFDQSRIKFKSDFLYNLRKFNYNIQPDFTQTNITLDMDLLLYNSFDNLQERKGGSWLDDNTFDGMFEPISDKERYNEINRTIKIGGYSTIDQVLGESTDLINKYWR